VLDCRNIGYFHNFVRHTSYDCSGAGDPESTVAMLGRTRETKYSTRAFVLLVIALFSALRTSAKLRSCLRWAYNSRVPPAGSPLDLQVPLPPYLGGNTNRVYFFIFHLSTLAPVDPVSDVREKSKLLQRTMRFVQNSDCCPPLIF
jgi:hypothetical protein